MFVQEYLRHGRKFDAYRKAFPDETQKHKGNQRLVMPIERLLAKEPVRNYIEAMHREIRARLTISPERILQELAAVGYSNMVDFVVVGDDGSPQGYDLSGLTADRWAAINELTIETYVDGKDGPTVKQIKLKLAPKLAALELMGKHLRLFADVVETDNVGGIAEVMREAREARRLAREKREPETIEHE